MVSRSLKRQRSVRHGQVGGILDLSQFNSAQKGFSLFVSHVSVRLGVMLKRPHEVVLVLAFLSWFEGQRSVGVALETCVSISIDWHMVWPWC